MTKKTKILCISIMAILFFITISTSQASDIPGFKIGRNENLKDLRIKEGESENVKIQLSNYSGAYLLVYLNGENLGPVKILDYSEAVMLPNKENKNIELILYPKRTGKFQISLNLSIKVYSGCYSCGWDNIGKENVYLEGNIIPSPEENREDPDLKNTSQARKILLPLISAAVADSINPCAFAVFIVLLTLLSYRLKKNILFNGLSFIAAVFIIYFTIGIGLREIFGMFPEVKYLIGGFGIFIGLINISSSLKHQKISLVPSNFQSLIKENLEKIVTPKGSFLVGVLVSIFLLPCTSGPYLIALNLVAEGSTWGVLLILLYNLIFIIPMLVILFAVYGLSTTTAKIKKWWAQREKLINFVIGAIILVLSLYVIFF